MKSLINVLLGSLVTLGLSCSNRDIQREIDTIVPDRHHAYKLAFPDTTYYKTVGAHFHILEGFDGKKFPALELFFDSNGNDTSDLIVTYRIKSINLDEGTCDIDSSKVPPVIFRRKEDGRDPFIYEYNPENKRYESMYETSFFIVD